MSRSPADIKAAADRAERLPKGRPTGYRKEFGDEIVSLMATGLSLTAAAAELGFHRDTIYEWEKTHPEFSDAVKLARGKRTLKLERDLLTAPDGPTVTSRIFALKNAAPDEWREKQTTELTGAEGAPLVPVLNVTIGKLGSEPPSEAG